ncbi:MAG: putative acetyltransferase [Chitinophagaceae bacterium]|nr:putative acetyltransferase [Chitinophagaceae bacterium]
MILIGHNVRIIAKPGSRIVVSDIGILKIGINFMSDKQTVVYLGPQSALYVYSCEFMKGCHLVLMDYAKMYVGYNTYINEDSTVEVRSKLFIGNGSALSKQIYITDSDMHKIIENGKEKTHTSPIFIGNKVWIGLRSVVLKGVSIGNNTVVAANSTVVKNVAAGQVVAGMPAKVVKENVTWEY